MRMVATATSSSLANDMMGLEEESEGRWGASARSSVNGLKRMGADGQGKEGMGWDGMAKRRLETDERRSEGGKERGEGVVRVGQRKTRRRD